MFSNFYQYIDKNVLEVSTDYCLNIICINILINRFRENIRSNKTPVNVLHNMHKIYSLLLNFKLLIIDYLTCSYIFTLNANLRKLWKTYFPCAGKVSNDLKNLAKITRSTRFY